MIEVLVPDNLELVIVLDFLLMIEVLVPDNLELVIVLPNLLDVSLLSLQVLHTDPTSRKTRRRMNLPWLSKTQRERNRECIGCCIRGRGYITLPLSSCSIKTSQLY